MDYTLWLPIKSQQNILKFSVVTKQNVKKPLQGIVIIHSVNKLLHIVYIISFVQPASIPKNYFTEILTFFFKLLFCINSGPGMQLTTTGMPLAQDDVPFGWLNSNGQAARWTSVPVHATEWTR